MKVLVLTNMYPHEANPVSGIFVHQQVESLRAKGIDIDVLFVNGPRNKLNYLWGIPRLWARLLTHHYDLIHAHYVYSGLIARMQVGCPVLVTYHSGEVFKPKQLRLSRFINHWIDGIIAVSGWVKDRLQDERASIIPCGVDLNWFRPVPQDEARGKLGLPQDKKLVLFAAAMRPEKRFPLVQESFALLSRERPDAELVVASGKPPEAIPLYMNACDVLVLPSDKEGSPQVVKEAMACNLPVVATPVGDIKELIGNIQGCYICRQEPGDIAAKLALVLANNSRTESRKEVERLSLERVADRIIEVYRTTVGSPSAIPNGGGAQS